MRPITAQTTNFLSLRENILNQQAQQQEQHLPLPLNALPDELIHLIVSKTDPETKAALSQVSRKFSHLVTETTKRDCVALSSQILEEFQKEAIPSDISTSEALVPTLTAPIYIASTLEQIYKATRTMRTKIAMGILSAGPLNQEKAEKVLSTILSNQEHEKNSAKKTFIVLQTMLEAIKKTDVTEKAKCGIQVAQRLLADGDSQGAVFMRSLTQDPTNLDIDTSLPDFEMASILAQKGDFEEALLLASRTRNSQVECKTYAAIALEMLKKMDKNSTFALFERIVGPTRRNKWIAGISKAIAQLGDIREALSLAESLPQGNERDWAYVTLVRYVAARDGEEIALAIANNILNPGIREVAHSFMYSDIAIERMRSKEYREADNALAHITKLKAAAIKNQSFHDIAIAWAHMGEKSKSISVARKITDSDLKTEVLKEISKFQTENECCIL